MTSAPLGGRAAQRAHTKKPLDVRWPEGADCADEHDGLQVQAQDARARHPALEVGGMLLRTLLDHCAAAAALRILVHEVRVHTEEDQQRQKEQSVPLRAHAVG